MPTKQRMEKAGGAFEIGGDGSNRIVRMLDTPLEQMRTRAQLTEAQYGVLARLERHWFLAHSAGSLRGVDLDRIALHNRYYGEASSQEVWHREMYNAALGSLLRIECVMVSMVVFEECSLNDAGASLGYRSPYRGRQFVLEVLRDAAGKIMSVWLTMERRGT